MLQVGINILGVVENMSGLEQRLTHVRFELETPTEGAGGAAGTAAAPVTAREDVTARILSIIERELGTTATGSLAGRVVVCTDVFEGGGGGAERMCREVSLDVIFRQPGHVILTPSCILPQMGVRLLGRVPLDPELGRAAESGRSIFGSGGQDDQGNSTATGPRPLCHSSLTGIVTSIMDICA